MLRHKINEKTKPLFLTEQIVSSSIPKVKSEKNLHIQKSSEKHKKLNLNKNITIQTPKKHTPKIKKSTPSISKKVKFILLKKNISNQNENEFLSKKRNENQTKKSFRFLKSPLNNGRWNQAEQKLFVDAILEHGNNWKKIQNYFITRSCTQIRSHAQKFLLKLKENQYLKNKGLNSEFCWTKAMTHLKSVLSIDELKKIFISINESSYDSSKYNNSQIPLTEKNKNQNSSTIESVENKNEEEKLNEEKNNKKKSNNKSNISTNENSKKNETEKKINDKFYEDNYEENNQFNFSPDFSCFNNKDFSGLYSNTNSYLNECSGIKLYENNDFHCLRNDDNIKMDDLIQGFRDRNLGNNNFICLKDNLSDNNITSIFCLNGNENNFNTYSDNYII